MAGPFAQLFRTGELERLPDERYEHLRMRAEARRADAAWVLPALAGIGAGLVWLGAGYLFALGTWAILGGAQGGTAAPTIDVARVGWINSVFGIIAGVIVFGLVREWMLSRSIRALLNPGTCPYCAFSLRGLTPELGAVRCPECGQMVELREHGIREEDIVVPVARAPGPGPRGAYEGRVPTGKNRRIRRAAGGIPRREEAAPKPDEGLSGEVL